MDKIVESVIEQMKSRSEVGMKKYGTNLERTDLTTIEWIEHAKQEALDFALYLERIKQDLLSRAGDINVAHKTKTHENIKRFTPRI